MRTGAQADKNSDRIDCRILPGSQFIINTKLSDCIGVVNLVIELRAHKTSNCVSLESETAVHIQNSESFNTWMIDTAQFTK